MSESRTVTGEELINIYLRDTDAWPVWEQIRRKYWEMWNELHKNDADLPKLEVVK